MVFSAILMAAVAPPESEVTMGAVVSITTDCATDATETLPAGSVLLAVIIWVAPANVDAVILQALLETVAVPIESGPE